MRRIDQVTGRIILFAVFVIFTTLWLMQGANLEGPLALANAIGLVAVWMALGTLWRKAETHDSRPFNGKAKRTHPADMTALLDRLADSLTPEERAHLERRLAGFDDYDDPRDLAQSLSALLDERERTHHTRS